VFDTDPDKVGRPVGNVPVSDYTRLSSTIREKNIIVGVVAVPADNAQRVADDLVESGVRIIFNYSEALLDVPQDVAVHTSNPAVELLYALYFYLT
jgi:redox-sensing transcriptional repressor